MSDAEWLRINNKVHQILIAMEDCDVDDDDFVIVTRIIWMSLTNALLNESIASADDLIKDIREVEARMSK